MSRCLVSFVFVELLNIEKYDGRVASGIAVTIDCPSSTTTTAIIRAFLPRLEQGAIQLRINNNNVSVFSARGHVGHVDHVNAIFIEPAQHRVGTYGNTWRSEWSIVSLRWAATCKFNVSSSLNRKLFRLNFSAWLAFSWFTCDMPHSGRHRDET